MRKIYILRQIHMTCHGMISDECSFTCLSPILQRTVTGTTWFSIHSPRTLVVIAIRYPYKPQATSTLVYNISISSSSALLLWLLLTSNTIYKLFFKPVNFVTLLHLIILLYATFSLILSHSVPRNWYLKIFITWCVWNGVVVLQGLYENTFMTW
jgi:hypothetical protein